VLKQKRQVKYSDVQYKNILSMIFNEIKCHVNTSLGLVGRCIPPVSAPVHSFCYPSKSKRLDYHFVSDLRNNHWLNTGTEKL